MAWRMVQSAEVPGGASLVWQQYADPDTAATWIDELARRVRWTDTGFWDEQQAAVLSAWEALGNVCRALNVQPFVNPHYREPFQAAYNDDTGTFAIAGLAFYNLAFQRNGPYNDGAIGPTRQRVVLALDGKPATGCFQRWLLDAAGNMNPQAVGPFWSFDCASGYNAIGTIQGEGCGRAGSIPGGTYGWKCWAATNDGWTLPSGSACMDLAREISDRMSNRGNAIKVLDDCRLYAAMLNLATYRQYVNPAATLGDPVSAAAINTAAAALAANDPNKKSFESQRGAAIAAMQVLGVVGGVIAHVNPIVGAIIALGAAGISAIESSLQYRAITITDVFGRTEPLIETVTIAPGNQVPPFTVPAVPPRPAAIVSGSGAIGGAFKVAGAPAAKRAAKINSDPTTQNVTSTASLAGQTNPAVLTKKLTAYLTDPYVIIPATLATVGAVVSILKLFTKE